MANPYQKNGEMEHNAANVVVECDKINGKIEGVIDISYGEELQRGYVKELGSRWPVAVTEGDGNLDQGKLLMRSSKVKPFFAALRTSANLASDAQIYDVRCTLTVIRRAHDEELSSLPTRTQTLDVFFLGEKHNISRKSADGLEVEIPFIQLGPARG